MAGLTQIRDERPARARTRHNNTTRVIVIQILCTLFYFSFLKKPRVHRRTDACFTLNTCTLLTKVKPRPLYEGACARVCVRACVFEAAIKRSNGRLRKCRPSGRFRFLCVLTNE